MAVGGGQRQKAHRAGQPVSLVVWGRKLASMGDPIVKEYEESDGTEELSSPSLCRRFTYARACVHRNITDTDFKKTGMGI